MEQFSYQRPREKLQSRGVGSLLTAELLQVIIGSGSKKVSGAKIAKKVAALLQAHAMLTYENLLAIQGLGNAKACQIIAALELGQRVARHSNETRVGEPTFKVLGLSKYRRIEYITINGSSTIVQARDIQIPTIDSAILGIRTLFADALHDGAASVQVGVGSRSFVIGSYTSDTLNIVKKLFDTADLLQIKVDAVWLVNKNEHHAFRRKELP